MRAVKDSLAAPLNRGMANRKVLVQRAHDGTNLGHFEAQASMGVTERPD